MGYAFGFQWILIDCLTFCKGYSSGFQWISIVSHKFCHGVPLRISMDSYRFTNKLQGVPLRIPTHFDGFRYILQEVPPLGFQRISICCHTFCNGVTLGISMDACRFTGNLQGMPRRISGGFPWIPAAFHVHAAFFGTPAAFLRFLRHF